MGQHSSVVIAGSDTVWAPARHVVHMSVTEGITGQYMRVAVCASNPVNTRR